jgi:hypothetical protein
MQVLVSIESEWNLLVQTRRDRREETKGMAVEGRAKRKESERKEKDKDVGRWSKGHIYRSG